MTKKFKYQIHDRKELIVRDLKHILDEMAYAANGILKESTDDINVCVSTEYIREKIRIISNLCDALDHDMSLPFGQTVAERKLWERMLEAEARKEENGKTQTE
jgi:hypothetical protein